MGTRISDSSGSGKSTWKFPYHLGIFRADPDEKLQKFQEPDFPGSTGNFVGGYSGSHSRILPEVVAKGEYSQMPREAKLTTNNIESKDFISLMLKYDTGLLYIVDVNMLGNKSHF